MITSFGFVRIACVVPPVRPADVVGNADAIMAAVRDLQKDDCDLILFPELCFTAYTCGDLFLQPVLLEGAARELERFLEHNALSTAVSVLGLPVELSGRLYNCAVVVQGEQILGVVPKIFLASSREYYESRWFSPGDTAPEREIVLCGQTVPFGTDLLFRNADARDFTFAIEVCEDLWAPVPPSCSKAMQGATVILNPSASNALVGKTAYRRQLIEQQSARCHAAYAYASAGVGESTTDMVFGGHTLIAENGTLLSEGTQFRRSTTMLISDIDVQMLAFERLNNRTFGNAASRDAASGAKPPRTLFFRCHQSKAKTLFRPVSRLPFVPAEHQMLEDRCEEILNIQSHGLATRMQHANLRHAVVGLSGGLDSTLALLVIRRAFDMLRLPHTGIHAITMPGFGTTERTLKNVAGLGEALDIQIENISITQACTMHMHDIGHDPAVTDTTYENVQARARTQILMNLANKLGGLVIGTGDLSEIALGWSTYNADHMSMYAVNCGVPKTLVRHLIRHVAESTGEEDGGLLRQTLLDILDTPVSPELVPPGADGRIVQKTEEILGPYEAHDFFLYNAIRRGFPPRKVLFLAEIAFGNDYPKADLSRWLRLFYSRFFSQQFKRSCIPDGPKVGTIALSPRADWRMPSDATAQLWLEMEETSRPANGNP
jgi:NAD+ synthase (glutamine-hydrolysing)